MGTLPSVSFKPLNNPGQTQLSCHWPGWDLNSGLPDSSLCSYLASALRDPREKIMLWLGACEWAWSVTGWVPWASEFASGLYFAHL